MYGAILGDIIGSPFEFDRGDKVMIRGEKDIFAECLANHGETTGRTRKFPMNRVVLLYAVIQYLLRQDTISMEDFIRRFRIVNNLVRNSEDEISDSTVRSSGNRMPAILRQIDYIMVNGIAGLPSENGLNTVQIDEETQKSQWIDDNPQLAEKLYELEDHALLYGQIGIIGLDNIALADSFMKLFGEKFDLDSIDCALMVKGNYGQYAKNQKRYQLGTSNAKATKAWQDLFHKRVFSTFFELRTGVWVCSIAL